MHGGLTVSVPTTRQVPGPGRKDGRNWVCRTDWGRFRTGSSSGRSVRDNVYITLTLQIPQPIGRHPVQNLV